MTMANRPAGLFQRFLVRSAPASVDAADMGTCIGLDYVLSQPDTPQPAAARGGGAPRWMQRFTARSKASAED